MIAAIGKGNGAKAPRFKENILQQGGQAIFSSTTIHVGDEEGHN